MVDFALLSTELQPQLSSGSKIVGPDETVVRWDDSCSPSPQATVFPANEQDVATIVSPYYKSNSGIKSKLKGLRIGQILSCKGIEMPSPKWRSQLESSEC